MGCGNSKHVNIQAKEETKTPDTRDLYNLWDFLLIGKKNESDQPLKNTGVRSTKDILSIIKSALKDIYKNDEIVNKETRIVKHPEIVIYLLTQLMEKNKFNEEIYNFLKEHNLLYELIKIITDVKYEKNQLKIIIIETIFNNDPDFFDSLDLIQKKLISFNIDMKINVEFYKKYPYCREKLLNEYGNIHKEALIRQRFLYLVGLLPEEELLFYSFDNKMDEIRFLDLYFDLPESLFARNANFISHIIDRFLNCKQKDVASNGDKVFHLMSKILEFDDIEFFRSLTVPTFNSSDFYVIFLYLYIFFFPGEAVEFINKWKQRIVTFFINNYDHLILFVLWCHHLHFDWTKTQLQVKLILNKIKESENFSYLLPLFGQNTLIYNVLSHIILQNNTYIFTPEIFEVKSNVVTKEDKSNLKLIIENFLKLVW